MGSISIFYFTTIIAHFDPVIGFRWIRFSAVNLGLKRSNQSPSFSLHWSHWFTFSNHYQFISNSIQCGEMNLGLKRSSLQQLKIIYKFQSIQFGNGIHFKGRWNAIESDSNSDDRLVIWLWWWPLTFKSIKICFIALITLIYNFKSLKFQFIRLGNEIHFKGRWNAIESDCNSVTNNRLVIWLWCWPLTKHVNWHLADRLV